MKQYPFNPSDDSKLELREIFPANIWEALRRNSRFCKDVDRVTCGDFGEIVDGKQEVIVRIKNAHPLSRKILGLLVPDCLFWGIKHDNKPLPSFSHAWPDTPEWFRRVLLRECSSWASSSNTFQLNNPKGEVEEIDIATWILDRVSEGPEGVDAVQVMLRKFKGRLLATPDVFYPSKAFLDKVVWPEIRKLLEARHDKEGIPTLNQWRFYALLEEEKKKGGERTSDAAIPDTVKRYSPGTWEDYRGEIPSKATEEEKEKRARQSALNKWGGNSKSSIDLLTPVWKLISDLYPA
jgi:hypothetical protein